MKNPFGGVLKRILGDGQGQAGTYTGNLASWFMDWIRAGNESDAGEPISVRTAMQLAAVWQANNIISGDVGLMPLVLYKRTPEGRVKATEHPAYRLVMHRPNPWMNANTWKEMKQSHALMRGNGRSGIVRGKRGEPNQLVPFLPDRTYEDVIDGKVWHFTRLGEANDYTPFRDADVLHIKGLGFDGITGYDVITLAKNSMGLGLAAEKHGSYTFRNSARPSVILESEGIFTQEAALKLLDDWQKMHVGAENTGRPALLQRGVKAKPWVGMTNENAQWLETRQFQRVEIAGWFNLPPHFLGDSEKAAYNSLESEYRRYLNQTLMRWLNAWEEECREKLLTEKEKDEDSHYFEFNTAAILRGDLVQRYQAYQIGIQNEWLSPNEVREMENMNKRADGGGDDYENPNTKSAGGQESNKPSSEIPAPESDTKTKAAELQTIRAAIRGRLEGMAQVEAHRVTNAAATSKNFVTWLDEFYDRWEPKFSAVCRQVGGDDSHGINYCCDSHNQLLELSGRATADTLAADVRQLLNTWTKRLDALVEDVALARLYT